MKPNVTLAQVSHLGITSADLVDVLNDHEELVFNYMEKAAKRTCGNVLGVGITAIPHPSSYADRLAFLLLVDHLDHATRKRLPLKSTAGFPIVIEEVGAIVALGGFTGGVSERTHELELEQGYQGKYRPVPCGVSIAPSKTSYSGTLGCQLISNKVPYMLSNNHVLADCNKLAAGTPISQPSVEDGGKIPADDVAELSYYVPLGAPGGSAPVDAAMAAYRSGIQVEPGIERDGGKAEKLVAPVTLPVAKMDVQKSGRTTGHTTGKVIAIGLTVATSYAGYGTVKIENAFSVEGTSVPFSAAGDSGSLVTTTTHNNPVGLTFASDIASKMTFANTMTDVLKELSKVAGHPVDVIY